MQYTYTPYMQNVINAAFVHLFLRFKVRYISKCRLKYTFYRIVYTKMANQDIILDYEPLKYGIK